MRNEHLLIVPVLMLMGAAGLIGWSAGMSGENDKWEKEAVSRGYGEYVLVDGGPKTEFKWKEKP